VTPATLVTGARAAQRERAIDAAMAPGSETVIILEGLAEGDSPLAAYADLPEGSWRPTIHRIAPGCLCCAGNLVLRVTLNRILRRPPAQLFISLADPTHLGQLRASLSAAPYDTLLCLGADLAA